MMMIVLSCLYHVHILGYTVESFLYLNPDESRVLGIYSLPPAAVHLASPTSVLCTFGN